MEAGKTQNFKQALNHTKMHNIYFKASETLPPGIIQMYEKVSVKNEKNIKKTLVMAESLSTAINQWPKTGSK